MKSVLRLLLSFDEKVKDSYKHLDQVLLIGVDEVGIGCLAGPVVAAAAVLPLVPARSKLAKNLTRLNDSKMLDPQTRLDLSDLLTTHAQYAIASATVEEIDEINILQAGLLAMKRSVMSLVSQFLLRPENIVVLIDGNKKIPDFEHEQICIIKGDSQSASIAAASVIAKVFRDQFMEKLALDFPHYSWHTNKGYGSRAHRQAISQHGVCKWHRRAFTTDLALNDLSQLELELDEVLEESLDQTAHESLEPV